ncbi:hypothetical protein VdG1_08407 [Verticillium dahliae VDG1]|nr:hypothetical protein VdG1_08407 [Verticillium dahliae VDG1]
MQQWQVGPVPEYIYSNSTHQPNEIHSQHPYQAQQTQQQPDMQHRDQRQFQYGPPQGSPAAQHQQHQQQQHQQHQQQQHHATPGQPAMGPPPAKKSRTNTPWTPAEEQRLKQMRDAGNSWAEIAKTFPTRTEGSVKKHWYKDMHYAEFAEDESQALLNAIKEYESNKWKVIGQKVGKPAKACEQYAKEHFPDLGAKSTR